MEYRICCDCKESKILEIDFSKNKCMSKGREYYCKLCRKIRREKWLATGNNKEKKLAQVRMYKKTDKFRKHRNNKLRNRTAEQRIIDNLRSRTRKAFLGFYKDDTTMNLVGCTKKELINHIISKFTTGMCLDNYGEWHLDHIIPLSLAKNSLELKKLCHYTNLQPLWAKDNLVKSNKRL
jgi:hypothetical protein